MLLFTFTGDSTLCREKKSAGISRPRLTGALPGYMYNTCRYRQPGFVRRLGLWYPPSMFHGHHAAAAFQEKKWLSFLQFPLIPKSTLSVVGDTCWRNGQYRCKIDGARLTFISWRFHIALLREQREVDRS